MSAPSGLPGRGLAPLVSTFLAGLWAAGLGLLLMPVYLRHLGAEAFGLFGFLLTLQAWAVLLDMGLPTTASREMARYGAGLHTPQGIRDLFASLEAVFLLVALLLGAALVAGAHWLATGWLQLSRLGVDEAARTLALMSAIVAAQWMATLYRSALNGLQLQSWLAGLTFVLSTLRGLGTLAVLLWISPRIDAFVLAQAAFFLVEAVAMRWCLARRLPPVPGRFRRAALRPVLRFAAGMTLLSLLVTLLMQMDRLLLSRLLSLEQFGYFTLAMTVVGALFLVISPLFNAAYPRLAELFAAGREDQLASEYHAFTQVAAFALLPLALTLALLAPQAIHAWTGDRHLTAEVAPLVSLWTIGLALNGILHVPHSLQLAMGWLRLAAWLNAIAVVVAVPAILFLVPRHGAIAAGFVWIGINLFQFVAGPLVLHRRVLRGQLARWYLRDIGGPLLGAAGVVLPCWLALRAWPPEGRFASGLVVLVVLAASGVASLAGSPGGRQLAGRIWRARIRREPATATP